MAVPLALCGALQSSTGGVLLAAPRNLGADSWLAVAPAGEEYKRVLCTLILNSLSFTAFREAPTLPAQLAVALGSVSIVQPPPHCEAAPLRVHARHSEAKPSA